MVRNANFHRHKHLQTLTESLIQRYLEDLIIINESKYRIFKITAAKFVFTNFKYTFIKIIACAQ